MLYRKTTTTTKTQDKKKKIMQDDEAKIQSTRDGTEGIREGDRMAMSGQKNDRKIICFLKVKKKIKLKRQSEIQLSQLPEP